MFSDGVAEKEDRNCVPAKRLTAAPIRQVKKAPVLKQDELKERRRGMFLRKVREDREEKRFESRGEDVSERVLLACRWSIWR